MNGQIIDLKEINTKQELHDLLSARLGFPVWYGRKWDAFWNMITDTDIVTMPNRLVLLVCKEFSERYLKMPDRFKTVYQI